MDYFYYGHFLEPEQPQDQELPVTERPEIQEAIRGALVRKGILRKYKVDIAEPVATDNPYVQRLDITIEVERATVPPPYNFMLWVDDFDLVFHVVRKSKPAH
jgi:hypothetical protein